MRTMLLIKQRNMYLKIPITNFNNNNNPYQIIKAVRIFMMVFPIFKNQFCFDVIAVGMERNNIFSFTMNPSCNIFRKLPKQYIYILVLLILTQKIFIVRMKIFHILFQFEIYLMPLTNAIGIFYFSVTKYFFRTYE